MEGEDVRQFRRTRQIVIGVIGVLVLLTAAAGTGAVVAVQYAGEATAQASIAVSRLLSAQSRLDLGGAPDRALLLAAEAESSAPTAEAHGALALAVQRTSGEDHVLRPGGQQFAVAVSPDGATLASGGPEGTVDLTGLATGALARRLPATAGDGLLLDLAFSPDGTRLATVSSRGVRLWNVVTGVPEGEPIPDGGDRLAFDPLTGALVVTGGTGTGARRYDPVRHSALPWPPNPHTAAVKSVAVSSRGVLATGSDDKTIALTGPAGDQRILSGFPHSISSIAFSPDGATLVAASLNEAQIWDVASGQKRGAVTSGKNIVMGVAVSRDGNVLATTGVDRTVMLWNLTSRFPLRTMTGHLNVVYDAAFGADGLLATAGWDGTVRVWNTPDVLPVFGPTTAMAGAAYSPDGARFVTGSVDGKVMIFDTRRRTQVGALVGHTTTVRDVAYSPDGAVIATASGTPGSPGPDNGVRLWDAADGHQRAVLAHPQSVNHVAFSPDGRRLATLGGDGHLRIWDVATGQQGQDLTTPTSSAVQISALAFVDDQHAVAATGFVTEWDLTTGTPTPLGKDGLAGLPSGVTAAAVTRDHATLALGSTDGQIVLWDVQANQARLVPFAGHDQSVNDLAFSPDGKTLASVGIDGNLVFFSAATGALIGAGLPLTSSALTDVAFRPDGGQIVTVGSDGGVRFGPQYLWADDPASRRDRACRVVGRNLTRAEWNQFLAPAPYQRTCTELPDGT